jgi:hypothetical protein
MCELSSFIIVSLDRDLVLLDLMNSYALIAFIYTVVIYTVQYICCISHPLIVPRAVIQDVSVFSASNNDVYLYIKRMVIVPKELHYEKNLSVLVCPCKKIP